ncbi:MAG: hypothetical protein VW124_09305 [Paracoccaceae bacterium]
MPDANFYILIFAFFAVFAFGMVVGFRKYRSFMNPISFHMAFIFFLLNTLSIISTLQIRIDKQGFAYHADFLLEHLITVGWISVLSGLFFIAPFIVLGKKSSIAIVESFFPRFLTVHSSVKPYWPHACILFVFVIICFSLLSYSSKVPYVWIFDPRTAYLYHRVGAGHFYLLTIYFLLFCFIAGLFLIRQRIFLIFVWTTIFTILSIWTGKKAVTICFLLITVLYYHFYIRSIGSWALTLLAMFSTGAVMLLVAGFGGHFDSEAVLAYFHYADVPALMLARFDEFGFYLGKVFLTSFWVLVPRALYPDKPFEYGDSLIHAVLFPGVAESGHTSGYFGWSGLYLDFGLPGVAFGALASGLLVKIVFEYFLYRCRSLIVFMAMIHFCFWPIWFFIPSIAVLLWLYLCNLFLRLRL